MSISLQRRPQASSRRRPVRAIRCSAATAAGQRGSCSRMARPSFASSSADRTRSLASPLIFWTPCAGFVPLASPRRSAQVQTPPSSSTTRAAVPLPPSTTALPRNLVLNVPAVFWDSDCVHHPLDCHFVELVDRGASSRSAVLCDARPVPRRSRRSKPFSAC